MQPTDAAGGETWKVITTWRTLRRLGLFARRLSYSEAMSLRIGDARSEVEFGFDLERAAWTRRDATALVLWFVLVAGVTVGGRVVNSSFATNVFAPPLFGRFDLRVGPATLLALAVACAVFWWGPRVGARIPWPALLAATFAAAGLWTVSLALVDGAGALAAPLAGPHDYLASVGLIDTPAAFLRSFADRLPSFSLHVQGHPPGMVLILWGMARLGLGGAGWASVVVIGAGTSASAATLLTVKSLAGESAARNLAPFLVLTPAAIWIATSADAFFMGVGAWGIALLALGAQRTSDPLAFAGGALLGLVLFLSYGAAALAPVALAVVVLHGAVRSLVAALGGVLVVASLFAAAGFWWFEGLVATVARYEAGLSTQRPYAWFVVANLGALALVVGPATAVGLARLRGTSAAMLTWAALAGVAAADLSGLSKGEVERIWLIFVPWLLVACVTFDLRRSRGMLALQALAALAIQTGVRTPW